MTYPHGDGSDTQFVDVDCAKSGTMIQMDAEQGDWEQLLFHDPPLMFAFLADAFRELDEIMNRVREPLFDCWF